MATRIGTEENSITMLEHLIALDYDALEAYDAAIRRLDDGGFRQQFAEFREDHERHIRELQPVVRHLGGDPPTEGDFRGVLAKGRVTLADVAGDEAILRAMKSSEDDTNTAYERSRGRPDVPDHVHDMLVRNQADEHRHRAWIEATLRTL
jgi:uncharacterized protein (TIGR02284 family)